MFLFIGLLILSMGLNACQRNKPTTDHLKNVTLKLKHPVSVKIEPLSISEKHLVLKPQIKASSELSDIQVQWLLEVNDGTPEVLLSQDFLRGESFSIERLKDVSLEIQNTEQNHKVVLIVSGKSDGKNFSHTAIYNSAFQEDIERAKKELSERSSKYITPDKL